MEWSFAGVIKGIFQVIKGIFVGLAVLVLIAVCVLLVALRHYSAAATADDTCGDLVMANLPDKAAWRRLGAGAHDAVINADGSYTARITIRSNKDHDKHEDRVFGCTVRTAPYNANVKSGWILLNMTELTK